MMVLSTMFTFGPQKNCFTQKLSETEFKTTSFLKFLIIKNLLNDNLRCKCHIHTIIMEYGIQNMDIFLKLDSQRNCGPIVWGKIVF